MKEQHSSHLRKIGACLHQLLIPEEREFVVDSGASMHMISKKDLNSAEMDTLTKSCSPTIVITANGEVQTHEEAAVCQRIGHILDYESLRKHASSIVVWKALTRSHRYEKKEGDQEYHTANQLKKKCRKRGYKNIHDRFIRDTWFRNPCQKWIVQKK